MKYILAILMLLFAAAWAFAQAPSYTTNFPATENPISQGGKWLNGKKNGIVFNDMQTTPGLAFGTAVSPSGCPQTPTDCTDNTAVLTGSWSADQMAQGTVHTVNQTTGDGCTTFECGTIYEEVELRLRTTITANSITGYEINFRCTSNGSQYQQIGKWLGPVGQFAAVGNAVQGPGLHNGDVVKATIVGNLITVYINGVQVNQATDSTFPSGGSPGIGTFEINRGGATTTLSDFGFTSFTAAELGNTPPAPPTNLRITDIN